MPAQITKAHGNILPTPAMPKDLPSIDLSDNSRQVLEKRYLRRGEDGRPVETIDEMFWRVAYHIAKVEETWGEDVVALARRFYQLMVSRQFFPNSPTFTGAGTPLGQLAACFVLPISDDMGRKSTGIFQTLRDAALIQQTGGGNGFSFSRLRPVGALVKSSAGKATGPVGFLRVYDHAFGEVAQGGSRRGANMAVVRVDHPDVEEFITCKTNENQITNFNISVGITDAFMEAVENDDMWELRFPDVHDPAYRGFDGTLEEAEQAGISMRVYKRLPARELFNKIVRQSHFNGEPGVLFLDAANRANPLPHLYQLESTNPCGEQWLGPYESCCLGSLNLAQYIDPEGTVEWDRLRQDIELSTRFLDDVVDANTYVPAVPQIEQAAKNSRRIGLGMSADDELARSVEIGDADLLSGQLGGRRDQFFDLGLFQLQYGGHATVLVGGVAHQLAAQADQLQGLIEGQGLGREEGGKFAQAVPCDSAGAQSFGQAAPQVDVDNSQGGLQIPRHRHGVFVTVPIYFSQRQAAEAFRFFPQIHGIGPVFGQIPAHAGLLRPLAGKNYTLHAHLPPIKKLCCLYPQHPRR